MSQKRGSAALGEKPIQEASKKTAAETAAAAAKDQLIELLSLYLASQPSVADIHKENEVEVRFGTRGKPLTKIDYNNIIQKLLSEGFTTESPDGEHYLRIFSEFINPETGRTLMSDNIRTEIRDLYLIQEYCRTNSIQKLLNMPQQINHQKIKFTQKRPAKTAAGENLRDVVFPDFNYSVSYKTERDFSTNTEIGRNIIRSWEENKKTFRFINRVRFSHKDYPIFVDISIVKTSKMTATTKRMIPTNSIDEAGVFSNQERYEVELEIDNSRIPIEWSHSNIEQLLSPLRTCIRIVLSGLHGSNFPIGNMKQNEILQEYMSLIHGPEYKNSRVYNKHFVGPSTYTLQISNVLETDVAPPDTPNIRRNYSVTDKADGERKMMYIDKHGGIYLIDINMRVTFTGAYTKAATFKHTLIDGEHILHDKNGHYINLYAAFDIYYMNERDVRVLPFALDEESADAAGAAVENAPTVEESRENKKPALPTGTSRIDVLRSVMQNIRPRKTPDAADDENPCDMTFVCKDFYWGGNIFTHCNTILSKVADGTYKYKTDGIVFTPIDLPVGGVPGNLRPPNEKRAWKYSLKWKKPEDNTIDFLVMTKKSATNSAVDEVFHIFGKGENLAAINDTSSSISQYKTLELRCGYNPKIHGYIDPWNTLIETKFSGPAAAAATVPEETDGIQPAIFKPTDPSMKNAHLCNIKLQGVDGLMKTEEGEIIEDHMIIEFSYDMTGTSGEEASRGPEWRWIPKRVRYDKTSEYRAGGRNYGNAYHVANANWYSIHHPITETMIMTGDGIPNFINEDVYYNNAELSENLTRPKRDFHNLFVKRRLISSVAKPKDTLIDYAVGKGGDIPKWSESRLSFVFGVDLYADNIQNRFDGACARYLNKRHATGGKIFRAMFVRGNSSLNIRSGEAMVTEKEKQITRAVFGRGEKDAQKLGSGVYDVYGEGENGFNISSCQFALHYFFESETTLHNFIRNVCECTKLGGCFIGTCYDGEEIFNLLRGKLENESVAFFTTSTQANESKKISEIIKRYSYTGFPDDFHSLGYKIDVYQENINQILSEYLVNFQYLVKVMEMYGFELDINNQDIPGGTQMFKSLYKKMEDESKSDRKKRDTYTNALKMTEVEKQDSFLNRCFVFRKVYEVNAEKVMQYVLKERKEQSELEMEYGEPAAARPPSAPPAAAAAEKPIIKKRRKRIIIEEVSPTAPAAAAAPQVTQAKIRIRKKTEAAPAPIPEPEPEPAPEEEEEAPAPAAEKKPCPPDQERSKKTGRCVKKCGPDQVRNEKTGRCIKKT